MMVDKMLQKHGMLFSAKCLFECVVICTFTTIKNQHTVIKRKMPFDLQTNHRQIYHPGDHDSNSILESLLSHSVSDFHFPCIIWLICWDNRSV